MKNKYHLLSSNYKKKEDVTAVKLKIKFGQISFFFFGICFPTCLTYFGFHI